MSRGSIVWFFIIPVFLLSTQCTKSNRMESPLEDPDEQMDEEAMEARWLIPEEDILEGGPGKDGIPSLSNPFLLTAEEATYLNEDDLVIGIRIGTDARAYPHRLLDWHEIVNDRVGGRDIAITYCPLTGTGIGWDREVEGTVTSFGISGLLYNSNMIAYDRNTDSNWSQMLLKSVNGEQIGKKIATHQVIETTWSTWKLLFPDTRVLSQITGYNRDYTTYPYGNYRTSNNTLIFPVALEDNRLPWKERVLGVVRSGDAKAYRFHNFPDSGIGVINDGFLGRGLVVAGSRDMNFMVAFERKLEDGTQLTFSPIQDELPVIMTDQEGNKWTVVGEAVAGPRAGTSLPAVDAFIGYWVAWGAFYPALRFR